LPLVEALALVLPLLLRARQSVKACPCMPAQLLAIEPEPVDALLDVLPVVCAPTTLAAANAVTISSALGLNRVFNCFILPPSFLME